MNTMETNGSNTPVTLLPNPGEGGPVGPVETLPDNGNTPVIPLPNPGEGGPVFTPSDDENTPVIPLPNPGEGGPVYTPPIVSPPNLNGPVLWPRNARVRFLNAAFGYQPFQVFVANQRMVSFLGYGSISNYGRVIPGYQVVTVVGRDGYIFLQKSIPFTPGSASTVAIINRAGGLDLLQIADVCCAPGGRRSNFRVSNLAYESAPMDVLLGDGRVIFADIRFKETTSFKQIEPGEYQFFFAETNFLPMPENMDIESLDSAFVGLYPVPEAVASLYLDVQTGANYTVFLLNSGTSTLQTLLVEDR